MAPSPSPGALVAGYALIQVKSRQQAVEWTRRFLNPTSDGRQGEIEARELFEPEDFERGAAVERFRDISVRAKK